MAVLKKLTPEQAAAFEEAGYTFPISALSSAEVADCQSALNRLLESGGSTLDPGLRHKPHLRLKWASDLVHHPQILDAVEDVLGPNLLVWRSSFFIKPPRDPGYIAWHQDAAYWALDSDRIVTAWLALTDSTPENGCVRMWGGSHRLMHLSHTIGFGGGNRLVRGQSLAVNVPDEQATDIALERGEFSLHHYRLVHGSRGNQSDTCRVGLVIRYIATHVKARGPRQSATLVRGVDDQGHFDLEAIPRYDDDPVALKWHRQTTRRYATELVWDALVKPTPRNLLTAARIVARPSIVKFAAGYLWDWARTRRRSE